MTYLKNATSYEELKKQYKKLALKYHPDREGGNEEIMKIINNEFDKLKDEFEKNSNTKENLNDNFKKIINELMKHNIDIELIGTWIWVGGDTKPIKDVLKKLGFRWHKKKELWFYHEGEYKRSWKKNISIEEIREKYNGQQLKKSSNKNRRKKLA